VVVAATAALAVLPTAAGADPVPEPEGLLGPFTSTDSDGVPLDHYDVTADAGGSLDWDAKLLLFLTDTAFAANRLTIGAGIWLLNWAFTFGPAEAIVEPARDLAETYQRDVIDRLGLPALLLTLGAAWCGVQIMRGRTSRGAAELAVSLLVSAVAVTVLARPAEVLLSEDGLLGQTRDTAMALTSITVTKGEDASADPEQAAQPLNDVLVDTFVVQPHQALNYGVVIGDDHPCRPVYDEIVAEGPWGSENDPRARLVDAGEPCTDLAAYNEDPTVDRLLASYLLLGATFIVTLLLILLICVLLIAVISAGVYVVLCPFALTAALLPGGGRQLLWRWIGGVVKTLLSIVAICVFIAVFTIFVQALLAASGDLPLVGRFALVDIAAIGGLAYHRKLLNAGTRASQRLTRNLEAARFGGTRGRGWMGPTGGSGAGLSPISATEAVRGARAEARRVTAPVQRAGRMAGKAWAGDAKSRAVARRGLPADAGRLQRRLSESRGGRILMGTGKAALLAGKVAVGSTIGAPIAIPKATAAAKAAATARSAATKAKLAKTAVSTLRAGKQTADAWARTPPLSTIRGAAAADADATRTRRLLSERPPVPRYSPAEGSAAPTGPTSISLTNPAEAPPEDAAATSAERLRSEIAKRRRPRRPGGR
jgi:hypothetical protein